MSWLRDVPIGVAAAHVEMMSRLYAEEALLASTVVTVGARKMRAAAARAHLAQWERASRPRRRAAERATPGQLQSIGIAYQVVEKSGG
jgi:hypothetical protein